MQSRLRCRPASSLALAAALALAAGLAARGAGAQIVTDGTAGSAGALTGPNYTIPQSLGTTNASGTTLLQSFSQFNLATGQTATFSGSNTLTAILARVTGGTASQIDGHISSTAANADLYLLNPAGFVFGPNASINVPAGLYISTADHLNMGDGSAIPITATPVGTLSVAPVASFGFVAGGASDITITGTPVPSAPPVFATAPGNVSLIASDITVSNVSISNYATDYAGGARHDLRLVAVGGVAGSVGLQGQPGFYGGSLSLTGVYYDQFTKDLYLDASDITLASDPVTGNATSLFLIDNSPVASSITSKPSIYITGDNLNFDKAAIRELSYLAGVTTTYAPGNVKISANNSLIFTNSNFATGDYQVNLISSGNGAANVSGDTFSWGVGRLYVDNSSIDISNSTISTSNNASTGYNLTLTSPGNISILGSTISTGQTNVSGPQPIFINSSSDFTFSNSTLNSPTTSVQYINSPDVTISANNIYTSNSIINLGSFSGHSGTISINSSSLNATNFTLLSYSWMGNGGNISFDVSGDITFNSSSADTRGLISGNGGNTYFNAGGAITANNSYFNSLSANLSGAMTMHAGTNLSMTDTTVEDESNNGAGGVNLGANGSIFLSSGLVASSTVTSNAASSTIDIRSGSDLILDNESVVAITLGGSPETVVISAAGNATLHQSTIDVSSLSGGHGGTVTISAGGTLSAPVTVIAADSVCSACAPSASPNGGKVTLTANTIDLPDSQITAKGDEGNGGTIDIAATQGLSADTTELSVASESSTQSGLYGGDMTLSGGQVSLTNDDIRLWNWMSGDRGGNFTVTSAGDLYLGATSIDASSSFANDAGRSNFAFTAGGTFTLDGGTLLDPAGDIAITAAKVALPALNSGSIDIRSVNATGGSVLIQAGTLTAGGLIPNAPPGGQFDLLSGAGSQVILRAQNLTWGPYALALSQAYGSNIDSGNIAMYANTLSVAGGLQSSASTGQAGTITLGATDFTLGGGTVSTAGQTGGQIYLGGDASITLTSGTMRSAVAARGPSGTDGNVYIGLKLTDPTVVNAACNATCQALLPYSTAWTPGTHFGVPPVHDLGTATLAASGGIGQVIFGWSTVVPEDLRVTPVVFDDQDTADTDPRDNGIEYPGVPFIHPRESDPHSVCTAKASREARNSLAYLLAAIPAQSPGIAGPEVFGLHPSSLPSSLAACAPASARTAATAGAN